MKALREWITDDGRLMTKGAERIILAMADVMEAAEQRTEFRSSPCVHCSYDRGALYKMCDYHAALSAATSVIKEVTG